MRSPYDDYGIQNDDTGSRSLLCRPTLVIGQYFLEGRIVSLCDLRMTRYRGWTWMTRKRGRVADLGGREEGSGSCKAANVFVESTD